MTTQFQDRSINCSDCHQDFVFTAGEQDFFQQKGFTTEPKRCKTCRGVRKAQKMGGGGGISQPYRHEAGPAGPGPGKKPSAGRELCDVVCASCGVSTRVPFKPTAGRPVYCRDCYGNQ